MRSGRPALITAACCAEKRHDPGAVARSPAWVAFGVIFAYKRRKSAASAEVNRLKRQGISEFRIVERWAPGSWREFPIEQTPVYRDPAALAEVENQIAGFPPLVFAG